MKSKVGDGRVEDDVRSLGGRACYLVSDEWWVELLEPWLTVSVAGNDDESCSSLVSGRTRGAESGRVGDTASKGWRGVGQGTR